MKYYTRRLWECNCLVITFTLDGLAANQKTLQVRGRLISISISVWYHCWSSVFNRLFAEIDCYISCECLVAHFCHSIIATRALCKQQERMCLTLKKLMLYSKTRWHIVFDILLHLHETAGLSPWVPPATEDVSDFIIVQKGSAKEHDLPVDKDGYQYTQKVDKRRPQTITSRDTTRSCKCQFSVWDATFIPGIHAHTCMPQSAWVKAA